MAALPPHKPRAVAGPALLPMGKHEGKPPIKITRPVYVIGSRSSARIHLVSSSVSKAHALLVRSNGRTYIRDLASRSKVIINNRPVREADLEDEDIIQIGSFSFKYVAAPGEDVPRPARKAPAADLEISGQDAPVPIEQRVILIGRRSICDLNLLEETVSTSHAAIFELDGQRFIRDLGSRSGTFVSGVSTHQHQLVPGDKIRIGETELRYVLHGAADEREFVDVISEIVAAPEPQQKIATVIPPRLSAPVPPIEVDEPIPLDLDDAPSETDDIPEAPIFAQDPSPNVEDEAIPMDELPAEEAAIDLPDEPQSDLLDLAGGEGTDAATFDAEALLAGGEVTPETEALPAKEIDLSAVELAESSPEESFESGPVEAIEPVLDLVEDSASAPQQLAPEVEPILDVGEPIAASADLVPLEEQDVSALPLIESTAMVDPPSAESIDLEPAPIETALTDLPVVPTEAPLTEPVAPIEISTEPATAELQPPPMPLVPSIKPRARRRTPRKKQLTPEVEAAEIIEKTDPTPESALQSAAEELAIDMPAMSDKTTTPADSVPSIDDLTDTKFNKAVIEFSGTESGDIVEPAFAPTDQSAGASFAPSSVEPEAPSETTTSRSDRESLAPESQSADENKGPAPEMADAPAVAPQQVNKPTRAPASPPGANPSGWGANQDNFLGGVPLNLWGPETAPRVQPRAPKSPFGDSRPAQSPFGRQQGRASTIPPSSGAAPGLPSLSGAPVPQLTDTEAHDQFVKELIQEIDGVASAAEAASKAQPRLESDSDDESLMMGAIPPRPRRAGARPQRRPPRRDETIPQTTSQDPTHGTITTGFDGLAMPPVREIDVFSQLAAPTQLPDGASPVAIQMPDMAGAAAESGIPGGDLLGAGMLPVSLGDPGALSPVTRRAREASLRRQGSGEMQDLQDGEEDFEQTASGVVARPSMRPTMPGTVDGTMVGQRRPAVAYAAELSESEIADVRRRYVRRIALLICIMLALMGGAGYGIYNYLGVNSLTEGTFRYVNLANLNKRDRDVFQGQQVKLLEQEVTRRLALDELRAEYRPDFLGSTIDYNRVVSRASFTDAHPDIMLIKVQSTDEQGDNARMMAVLRALYKANVRLVEEAKNNRQNLEAHLKAITQAQQDIKRMTDEIARLRSLGENRPTAAQIATLQAQIDELEKAWNVAVKQLKDSQVELERLKSAPPESSTAGAAQNTTAEDDEKIRSLQLELNQRLSQVNQTKTLNSLQSASAKKSLDAALDGFKKQVADAQAMANGNPEIAAFIKSAEDLQQTTRQLTDDLIRTQEQEFGRLMELKNRLNEKMEQRRTEAWMADKELAGYKEKLDATSRRYNTALGGGLQKEAEELKATMDLLNAQIKQRQDALPPDSFYSDVIQQIQVIVDSTRKNIEDNRARVERSLTALQQSFRNNQTVQKLPEEQKQLADRLQNQLAQINDARKQYNQALDAGADDADATVKSEINTFQAAIDLRRKELANSNLQTLKAQQEQSRLAAIEAKQSEVTKLTDAEKVAGESYFAKNHELSDLKGKVADAIKNDEELDTMIRQKGATEELLLALNRDLEIKKTAASDAIEPVKPNASDLNVSREQDRRLLYTLVSCGSILVLFFVLILWNIHSLSLEAPQMSIRSTDLQPMNESDLPGSNGESGSAGGTNGNTLPSQGNPSPDDHQPAIV